jgi:hypothetical protein
VLAVGESKLRQLTLGDYHRLDRIRNLLKAPNATIVLASTTSIAKDIPNDADSITLHDVYPQKGSSSDEN